MSVNGEAAASVSDTETVLHSFMSFSEAVTLCHQISRLAREQLPPPDLVVGVANGGTLPAFIVANDLQAPLRVINVRRKGSGLKQRLKGVFDALKIPTDIFFRTPLRWVFELYQSNTSGLTEVDGTFDFPIRDQHVLIVDDSVVSGRTMEYIRGRFLQNGASRVSVAVMSCGDISAPDIAEPEIILNRVFQFFPWSNNSPYWREYMEFMKANQLAIWN